MMLNNLSEKDILNVFLESDTDEEEDCLIIDEKVSLSRKDSCKSIDDLNNLDEETCFEEDSEQFESQIETNPRCINIYSKSNVDLASIFPPADSEEIQRGYMVRQIGDNLDPRNICLDCGKHYARCTVISHRKLHLGVNLYICEFCQKKYSVKREFDNHVRTHTRERHFTCPRCMQRFGTNSGLRAHICPRNYSQNVVTKINQCVNTTSKNVVDLTSIFPPADSEETQRGFMVRQIGEKLDPRYICLDCGNHYSHKGDIYNHRILKFRKNQSTTETNLKGVNISKKNKNVVDLTCIFPPANFKEAKKGYMARQIQKGENLEKRLICLDCGKHFAKNIYTHRKLHLGKNLYTCEFCQKRFAVKQHYEDHVRTHTGERPFTCSRCGFGFTSSRALGHHKKRCLVVVELGVMK